MSLITRCPACQTLFKVVPDQLRISEGWVRCGQCDAIFDASLHLLPQTPQAMPQGADNDPDSAPVDSTDEVALELAQVLPDPALQSATELSDLSFLRNQHAGSLWRKPIMRAMLVFLSLALLLGLAGQIVFHERDRIVALEPGLKPWLLAFCGPLHCKLSALQQRDSVAIGGASFTKLGEDSYRLNFTLKNTATIALAVPAIELVLTDLRDQPVLRRVFLATELGVKSDTLAPGSEGQSSLTMAVNGADKAEPIVGYRLYAFYP